MRTRTGHGGRTRRAGSALLLALMIVTVTAVMSMTYLQLSLTKNREQKTSVDAKRAFYVAEAGLSESVYGLAIGKSGNVGSPGLPARFGSGVYWVTEKDEGQGRSTLTSTGLCGGGRAAVSLVVQKASSSIASLGVFGDQRVVVQPGVKIDSWDSRNGPYTVPKILTLPLPSDARVGCNANITVQNTGSPATTIYGDAHPGPLGLVLRDMGAVITGSTAPASTATELPAIVPPSGSWRGSVDYDLPSPPLALPGGASEYGNLRVRAGARAVVTGPATLVVSSLQIDPSAQLTLDASAGAVKLYVTDYLNLCAGSSITTPSESTSGVSLLVSASETADRDGDGVLDPPARVLAGGTFYGTIYAPAAALSVPASLELFGSVAARAVTVMASAKVHFDLALTAPGAQDPTLPHLLGWRLVDLPDSKLVSLRYDPLQVLRVNGITPVLSKDAHYDVGIAPAPDLAGTISIR